MNDVLTAEMVAAVPLARLTYASTYHKGFQYYRMGRARVTHCDAHRAVLAVQGSRAQPYRVTIEAVGDREILFDCNCAAFEGDLACQHIIASLLALAEYLRRNPPITWETVLAQALQKGAPSRKAATPGRALLLFSLQRRDTRWGIYLYSIPAKGFPEDAPLTPDAVARTVAAADLSREATSVRTFNPSRFVALTPDALRAARVVALMQTSPYYAYGGYYGSAPAAGLEQALPLLSDVPLFLGEPGDPLERPLTVAPEPATAALQLAEGKAGLHVQPILEAGGKSLPIGPEKARFLTQDPPWVLIADTLYCLEGANAVFLALAEREPVTVPAEAQAAFFERYLLPLAEHLPLRGDMVAWQDAPVVPPRRRLYLSERNKELRAHLRFVYGEEEFPYDPALPDRGLCYAPEARQIHRIVRVPEAEQRAWEDLSEFRLKRETAEPGWFTLRARTEPIDFLMEQVPRLSAAGYEVFGEEALTAARVNRSQPTMSLRVSSGIDWFDVEAVVQFGDVEASLGDLRRAVRKRERYVKLADGTIGMLPEEWLEKYRHLFALGEEEGERLRFSSRQALLLDQLITDSDGSAAVDEGFIRQRERLRRFTEITPQALPQGLTMPLYPYQKAGFDWLHFLHEYDFGGCLADDMGLGKTAQTLTFLLSLRQASGNDHTKLPDLIVVPRSLLFNWEREANRFTPDLRILIYADGRKSGDEKTFGDYDLILTTYRIMLGEIETLRKCRFHYAVLDEAQAIKNPLSQTARAARLLPAEHRLTLTGTPVENSPLELWSQFAFLNPGMLGGMESFRTDFGTPIERQQDEATAQTLRHLIRPFLLRRLKEEVAPELPPRTEELLFVEMEPAQRRVYHRLRDQYRAQVLGLLDQNGMNGAQMKILEGLLRLRQLCDHPKLVEPDFRGDSAKLTALLETLETLASEGHKALVFSQFVQMLTLVREALDAQGIPYVYLDGRTRNRQERVDQFQNDPAVPFFLISLKAGGVGLNLTAADYVLHIDPWWNPAVEQQATDRAHRIGQDKPVFIYKFITKDSVEEKILQLQERKKHVVEQLITAETGMFKSLTRDDIAALFS